MISRESKVPLYRQLYLTIKEDIQSGTYSKGAHLPPERVLCEQYGLDRTTVRKGLSLLSEESLITRRQGHGTVVMLGMAASAAEGNVLFALCKGPSLTDRLGEPFYTRLIDALEQSLNKQGERLVYSSLHPDDDVDKLARRLEAKAVIAAGAFPERLVQKLKALDLPVVIFNTAVEGLPSVSVDNDGGALRAARRLLALGHKNVGFIHVPGYSNAERRLGSFLTAWSEAGLSRSLILRENGDWTETGGYEAAAKLIERGVTAIFSCNDIMGMGAIKAVRDAGLRVPEDISVIGFDDIPQASMLMPPLTSVRTDVRMMAEAACMLMSHRLKTGSCSPICAVIPGDLVERASIGPVRSE